MILSSKNKIDITIFYLGFLLKVVLGTLFASATLTQLFIPFLNYFISHGFANPYEQFASIGKIAHFPYPALMLYQSYGFLKNDTFFKK